MSKGSTTGEGCGIGTYVWGVGLQVPQNVRAIYCKRSKLCGTNIVRLKGKYAAYSYSADLILWLILLVLS